MLILLIVLLYLTHLIFFLHNCLELFQNRFLQVQELLLFFETREANITFIFLSSLYFIYNYILLILIYKIIILFNYFTVNHIVNKLFFLILSMFVEFLRIIFNFVYWIFLYVMLEFTIGNMKHNNNRIKKLFIG